MFWFDWCGVGDLVGFNGGYVDSKYDIFNVVWVFGNLMLVVECIVGFGNCDVVVVFVLFGCDCGVDVVIFVNLWLCDEIDVLFFVVVICVCYFE